VIVFGCFALVAGLRAIDRLALAPESE
jgi:hypothetical protein